MTKQYMSGRGYSNANGTKEALTGQPEIKQLSCAAERGIYRPTKHDNRRHKKLQHEQNMLNRNSSVHVKKGK